MDWTYIVIIGIAAVVGYFLAPRKTSKENQKIDVPSGDWSITRMDDTTFRLTRHASIPVFVTRVDLELSIPDAEIEFAGKAEPLFNSGDTMDIIIKKVPLGSEADLKLGYKEATDSLKAQFKRELEWRNTWTM